MADIEKINNVEDDDIAKISGVAVANVSKYMERLMMEVVKLKQPGGLLEQAAAVFM